jgi:KaiC/GvpD/RAD55 family RecA-like ATPase
MKNESMDTESDNGTPMTFGIDSLDIEIGPKLSPGNVILWGGITGSGKTVIACQLAVSNTAQEKKVLMLSTRVSERDFLERCVSNGAQIPCDENMKIDFVDGKEGRRIPLALSPDHYDEGEKSRGMKVMQNWCHHSTFVRLYPEDRGLAVGDIQEAIEQCEVKPSLIILDYLEFNNLEADWHKARGEMLAIMEYLRDLARNMNINIVVFAQTKLNCINKVKVPVTATSDCKTLYTLADATIMMSWIVVPDWDESHAAGYAEGFGNLREQYLNVQGSGLDKVLPVQTDYEYMTLREGSHAVDGKHRDHVTVLRDWNKALEVVESGGMNHYFWFGRSVHERLLEIGYPPAINVYIFHMMAANKRGISKHSFKGMAEKMGLSIEQVRTAIDKLKAAKLLEGVGQKRDMRRRVMELEENTAYGDGKGSVKLNQNMMRADSTVLRKPEWFRLWVHLILNAESKYDAVDSVAGEVVINLNKVVEDHKVSSAELEAALKAFESDGRISFSYGAPDTKGSVRIKLINWWVYQLDVPKALSEGLSKKRLPDRAGKQASQPTQPSEIPT